MWVDLAIARETSDGAQNCREETVGTVLGTKRLGIREIAIPIFKMAKEI